MSPKIETEQGNIDRTAPLSGRTFLLPRTEKQSDDISSELESFGSHVISLPLLNDTSADSSSPLDDAIENLYGYDWIIFTNRNTVAGFFRRLLKRGITVAELDDLKICAVGEATVDCLRDWEVHVDVSPMNATAKGVLESLTNYIGSTTELSGLNLLLPYTARQSRELLFEIENVGARCDAVAINESLVPAETERARLRALLAGGAIDCIVFTTPLTVQNFAALFEAVEVSSVLHGVSIVCIGDATLEAARSFHLTADIQFSEFDSKAFARDISQFFTGQD